jgi:hypothetical protein
MALDRYAKASEAWLLLHQVEQLIINDPDYHPSVLRNISNCMDAIETLQHSIECSGDQTPIPSAPADADDKP